MPMSVMPRRSIVGSALPSRTRPAVSSASVSAVASGSVWDLVAREKSSKRSRSVTVRETRCALPQAPREPVDERDQVDVEGFR